MGDFKTPPASHGDITGEAQLRGGPLSNDQARASVDRTTREQSQDTDAVLRTDDEEDTLYNDGLELESGNRPLTGVNGKDDSR